MKRQIISILAENNSGVLLRICGMFSRRGYSIESLSAGTTEDPTISRLTIVTTGDSATLEQIEKQLMKLVNVREVRLLPDDCIKREHIIIRAGNDARTRTDLMQVANLFDANVLDVDDNSLAMELTGEPGKITAFIRLVQPYHIQKLVRTGLSALERE